MKQNNAHKSEDRFDILYDSFLNDHESKSFFLSEVAFSNNIHLNPDILGKIKGWWFQFMEQLSNQIWITIKSYSSQIKLNDNVLNWDLMDKEFLESHIELRLRKSFEDRSFQRSIYNIALLLICWVISNNDNKNVWQKDYSMHNILAVCTITMAQQYIQNYFIDKKNLDFWKWNDQLLWHLWNYCDAFKELLIERTSLDDSVKFTLNNMITRTNYVNVQVGQTFDAIFNRIPDVWVPINKVNIDTFNWVLPEFSKKVKNLLSSHIDTWNTRNDWLELWIDEGVWVWHEIREMNICSYYWSAVHIIFSLVTDSNILYIKNDLVYIAKITALLQQWMNDVQDYISSYNNNTRNKRNWELDKDNLMVTRYTHYLYVLCRDKNKSPLRRRICNICNILKLDISKVTIPDVDNLSLTKIFSLDIETLQEWFISSWLFLLIYVEQVQLYKSMEEKIDNISFICDSVEQEIWLSLLKVISDPSTKWLLISKAWKLCSQYFWITHNNLKRRLQWMKSSLPSKKISEIWLNITSQLQDLFSYQEKKNPLLYKKNYDWLFFFEENDSYKWYLRHYAFLRESNYKKEFNRKHDELTLIFLWKQIFSKHTTMRYDDKFEKQLWKAFFDKMSPKELIFWNTFEKYVLWKEDNSALLKEEVIIRFFDFAVTVPGLLQNLNFSFTWDIDSNSIDIPRTNWWMILWTDNTKLMFTYFKKRTLQKNDLNTLIYNDYSFV